MKPCKKPICARVLAALPLLAAPAWADDLIVDGSFEASSLGAPDPSDLNDFWGESSNNMKPNSWIGHRWAR